MVQPENKEINRFRRLQINNFAQVTMPYLAAFVDEGYYEITLVDEYCQRLPYKKRFGLVAITVNTPNATHCYEISARFKKNGAKVVMGGPHATLLPDEVSRYCDYLIVGEAEGTWVQFLDDFRNGYPNKIYKSVEAPGLSCLPLPRWDLLKRNRVMKGAIFATRGCPYNCRYCNLKQIYHNCFRARPVGDVVLELKAIKSKFFVFWDDNLFADKTYAIRLFQEMKPLKSKWAAQASLRDCMDDDLLKAAKEAGCLYLFIGIESFSEESLNYAGKNINRVSEYEEIIEKIHRHGIMVQAGIIFGFDNDSIEVFYKTLEACEQLGIDGATVSILTPFPKTPIYGQFKDEGRLLGSDWAKYNSKTAVVFEPKNMSADELFEGYNYFRKRFYSVGSFIKRMKKSRTNIIINFFINLGYRMGVR
jgi:radical SAM superfamily enzyme YgiQ (UPF0313 family)